jgi:hypothetical protein
MDASAGGRQDSGAPVQGRSRTALRTVAATGVAVSLALLGSFYSVVASAVDRGERRAFAADQSDIDEDLRTPNVAVVSVRAAPSR